MLHQRVALYTGGHLVKADTKTLKALLDAKQRRDKRISNYRKALSDHKVYDSEKERFKQQIEHAEAVTKRQAEQIKELTSHHGRSLLKPALESPKKEMQIGKIKAPVPVQAVSTVEKYKDDPDFKKTVEDVAAKTKKVEPESESESESEPDSDSPVDRDDSSKWTAGRIAKYAIITSGIAFLFYKLRDITIEDVTNFFLLMLAMT